MPTKDQHVQKAEGNLAFALSLPLDIQARIDWALVAVFYAALHYVEAYLADTGWHLRSHQTRDNVIGRDANLKKIFHEYQDLKFYAYNARYEVLNFTAANVTGEAIPSFQIVKTHLQRLL